MWLPGKHRTCGIMGPGTHVGGRMNSRWWWCHLSTWRPPNTGEKFWEGDIKKWRFLYYLEKTSFLYSLLSNINLLHLVLSMEATRVFHLALSYTNRAIAAHGRFISIISTLSIHCRVPFILLTTQMQKSDVLIQILSFFKFVIYNCWSFKKSF